MNLKKTIFCVLIIILFFQLPIEAVLDLKTWEQDFVLETKKLEIPGYPDAFNPAIIRWNGAFLMSFRIRDPLTAATGQIGLIWLDDDFNLASDPQILDMHHDGSFLNPRVPGQILVTRQDPRLISVGNALYIVYSNLLPKDKKEVRRVFIAELSFDGNLFSMKMPQKILFFEDENPNRVEKNWVPFDYQGDLLLAYSLDPHRILQPLKDSQSCKTLVTTKSNLSWHWGELRGGTPALVDGNCYLSFFHTCYPIATVQSKGRKVDHYFMGAYTFSSKPPFEMKSISPVPIIHRDFYHGPSHKTWKELYVVFPAGLVIDENYIWVSYGRQDHEMWIAKMDKKILLNSLIPVEEDR